MPEVRVATVLGARPQFIKAAPVSAELRQRGCTEYLIHTGQHYDTSMSGVFFDELGLERPAVDLHVGSGPHGAQTAQMLAGVERELLRLRPDWVLVYGDTNSTLAGALAACKLRIPVAHVEAGLRSFNRAMPEEHNRVLTDHCADRLLCPTETARANLEREGLTTGVSVVGDTMLDAVLQFGARARERSRVLADLGIEPGQYLLATLHRPYNTDHPGTLGALLDALAAIEEPVIFPAHPRTTARMAAMDPEGGRWRSSTLRIVEPVGYLDMLQLEQSARLIITDSGGVQKEAYFFKVPCVTVRPETEWVETVAAGMNVLAPTPAAMLEAAGRRDWPGSAPPVFGDGHAAARIVTELLTPS